MKKYIIGQTTFDDFKQLFGTDVGEDTEGIKGDLLYTVWGRSESESIALAKFTIIILN